jgi:hypothetical protein
MGNDNKELKVNMTSSAVEKGLDIAKDFLNKLIMPAVEETGLLFKDQVASWRFRNQIKILNKAKNICDKNNITTKAISLKLLCPYLENASLEEDDEMQEGWAALLSNLVDSEQNIENNIFPYILSQISKEEFLFIKGKYQDRLSIKYDYIRHLEQESEIIPIELEIDMIKKNLEKEGHSAYEVHNILWKDTDNELKLNKINEYRNKLYQLEKTSKQKIDISIRDLELFELNNLIRIGIVEKITINDPKIDDKVVNARRRATRGDYENKDKIDYKDLQIKMNSQTGYYLNELGEIFINACIEKSN